MFTVTVINRMQSVLNCAARFVFSASRCDRITPLLTQLQWLKVPQRIKFKLLFWYTDAYVRPLRRALLRNFIVICCRGSSASPLCIDIIACCPKHPSFNHRRSGFSGRCCPTVKHSAAERHVGVVNICFQETFEDPSLNSYFPRISCSDCAVTLSCRTL